MENKAKKQPKTTDTVKKRISVKERNRIIQELSKEANKNITKRLFKQLIGA